MRSKFNQEKNCLELEPETDGEIETLERIRKELAPPGRIVSIFGHFPIVRHEIVSPDPDPPFYFVLEPGFILSE